MNGRDRVDAPRWPDEAARWVADDLDDRGVRYADKFAMSNGWIYKAIGDRHPPYGILAVPDWAPASLGPTETESRDGMVKVRDHRWPDGSRAPRMFDLADVPLYLRRYEVIPWSNIVARIVPETAARDAMDGSLAVPESVHDILGTLGELTGVEGSVGLNGSLACGLGRPWSDVDVDVFGSDSIAALTGALAFRELPRGWVRRWPPDEQTNLYYICRAAYADASPDVMRRAFHDSGRDVFNFLVDGTRVSVSYHSAARGEPITPAPRVAGEAGPPREFSAVIAGETAWGTRDLPAIFECTEVRAAGEGIADRATVVSDSKAFGFSRAGDVVRFVARSSASPDGLVLHMPSYGPEWPVWPLPLT
jgi:hypothetical protein